MSILPKALTVPARSLLSRWFAARAPKSDNATLNLRNVYIFFSREGLLFAVLLIITFIAGINYGNNLVLGLCFYLISVWLISFHVTFAHISGLQVRLLDVTMAEAGALFGSRCSCVMTAADQDDSYYLPLSKLPLSRLSKSLIKKPIKTTITNMRLMLIVSSQYWSRAYKTSKSFVCRCRLIVVGSCNYQD